MIFFFFFQAEDGIRDYKVTGVQTCALPICQTQLRARRSKKCRPSSRAGQVDHSRTRKYFHALRVSQSDMTTQFSVFSQDQKPKGGTCRKRRSMSGSRDGRFAGRQKKFLPYLRHLTMGLGTEN